MPLRYPARQIASRRYIRLRQTGADRIYYWSIAELHIYGDPSRA